MALASAVVIWLFVNNSITDTKTVPNVPIRIVNLPADKTVVGLLPNRLLSKRVTLTLSGTKDVIQELEPGDLEVLLDVSSAESDEWVAQISKKNLVSLNPSIDLLHHITQVDHPKFVLKLSPLVTVKIPVKILPPSGEAPIGYEYLDVWPQTLTQTVSGSQEEINMLKEKGLTLSWNLSEITKADLDALETPKYGTVHDDEISYFVPEKWKKLMINQGSEEINDPDAQGLRIDFLRKEAHPIGKALPIRVFYPLKNSGTINPTKYPLAINQFVLNKNDITIISKALYVRDVSRLFLEIISENMEINIVAAPSTEREVLQWSLEVIDPHELEDMYVAYLTINSPQETQQSAKQQREIILRKRFHDYMRRLAVYSRPDHRLHLEAVLNGNAIQVRSAD
ncbi:MAG: hypothetical protein H0X51_03795 [Parachlamydiaceae bacterium]|nr:hypothetical protein [Parachlamydiaceae bacterium]